jgi:hypothetical protein
VQNEVLDKISVVSFEKKHFPLLLEMLSEHNHNTAHITMKTLPKIGYIALLDKNPIAAGFLRRIEGDVLAQLDGLTSNPCFGSIIRHIGINEVVKAITTEAKQLKLKGIMAFTVDKSVLLRAEDLGFQRLAHSVISLTF